MSVCYIVWIRIQYISRIVTKDVHIRFMVKGSLESNPISGTEPHMQYHISILLFGSVQTAYTTETTGQEEA